MKISEKRLWYELDKIATIEAEAGANMAKSNAAANMMKFLKKPSHTEIHRMWVDDGSYIYDPHEE